MQEISEVGQLVQSYSIELENNLSPSVPPNDLRRLFTDNERRLRREEEERASWRKYYESWEPLNESTDPTTRIIHEQAVQLSQTWIDFRAGLSKDERDQIEGKKPSVEGLVDMVITVRDEWQNKRTSSKSGRAMKHFTSFCETLKAHSYMLEILPEGSEYVSLFTGSLKTIINASSNYETIAAGIGNALSKMSEHIIACQKEVSLYRTKDIQEKIARLYAHVFLFLQKTMKWYLKKPRHKLQTAFREDFYKSFEDMILNIQELSQDVRRAANLSSMAELRQIGLNTEKTLDEVRFGNYDAMLSSERAIREQAETKHEVELLRLDLRKYGEMMRQLAVEKTRRIEEFDNRLFLEIRIGNNTRQQLLWDVQRDADDRKSRILQLREPMTETESHLGDFSKANSYQRDTIILDSNQLLDIFSPSSIESPFSPPYGTPIFLDTSAASRLKEWTSSPKSHVLSIAGRHPKGLEPPPMTVLASMCIEFANSAKLPVISYFCLLPRQDELRTGNIREEQALLSLAYALIRQLIENLPVQFSTEFGFGKERLDLLNGTLESWHIATALLRDLVDEVPKPLFCIIDGFQLLNSWKTEGLFGDFFKALRGSDSKQVSEERMKVLVTTTGRSSAVSKHLDAKEMVLADRDGAVDSPARRGGNARLIL